MKYESRIVPFIVVVTWHFFPSCFLLHKFFWISTMLSAARKSYHPLHHCCDSGFLPTVSFHAQILLDIYHNLRHHRVCRIPWGVCDKLLDNGQRKVALGAIRDLTVQCANTRVADNLVLFAKQLQAIPPAPGVADYLVLVVSGRSKSSYNLSHWKIQNFSCTEK